MVIERWYVYPFVQDVAACTVVELLAFAVAEPPPETLTWFT